VLILMLLFLMASGCNETLNVDPIPQPDENPMATGNIITEQFTVSPEGGNYTLLGETLCLSFPEGAVEEPTLINVATFPLHHLNLNGLNLMNRGISIETTGKDKAFGQIVKIRMKYDVGSLMNSLKGGGDPVDETSLTIYSIYGNYFRFPNIYPIGECCVDCDCKSVIGCICESGTFVVGEN